MIDSDDYCIAFADGWRQWTYYVLSAITYKIAASRVFPTLHYCRAADGEPARRLHHARGQSYEPPDAAKGSGFGKGHGQNKKHARVHLD